MPSNLQIAVLDDYQGAARDYPGWDALQKKPVVTFFADHLADPEELVDRLAPFDVICLMRERTSMDAALIARLPRLKLIVTTAMRNAVLDIRAAQARGITVCGTGAIHTGTPELTWLLILALARNLAAEQQALQSGEWQAGVGKDLSGSTLGIVGLGRVGTRVAGVAQAFGMHVLAWSPHLTPERAAVAGATCVSKTELFERSDFVSLSLQLSDSTRNVVDRDELSSMKPGAFLVNTSRAPLVNEDALIEALRQKKIAGAGLDVHAIEPLPETHPLRSLPNVVLTPHIGYVTEATYRQFFEETIGCIAAWIDGKPIRELQPEDGAKLQ